MCSYFFNAGTLKTATVLLLILLLSNITPASCLLRRELRVVTCHTHWFENIPVNSVQFVENSYDKMCVKLPKISSIQLKTNQNV